MTEEILGELHKLEITSANAAQLATIRLIDTANLPLNLNPFYKDEKKTPVVEVGDGETASSSCIQPLRNQQSCRRCRLRRRSESFADDYKSAALATTTSDATCWTHSTLGVQRNSLKHRRNILRPPVLRKLQNLHKLLQMLPDAECDRTHTAVENNSLMSSANGESDATNTGSGICDFRDLIHECQNLLELETDVKGRFGIVSPDQRVSKNFTTIQSLVPPRSIYPNEDDTNFGDLGARLHLPERNSTGAVTRTATTTSCSQQAGNSAAAVVNSSGGSDDVTIDELASYFDIFVHIPKKMSTMAEMMYI